MNLNQFFFLNIILTSVATSPLVFASGTMDTHAVENVLRADISTKADKERLSISAGLLADYEIIAKKLIDNLKDETITSENISNQATELLNLSEDIISSAQFRLPQCEEYLTKTLALKDELKSMSHETLETDYHHDGALPKAPAECYHTKDLFVHPATVIILTRDDPSFSPDTKLSIEAEITEVMGHTELVRQLVFY